MGKLLSILESLKDKQAKEQSTKDINDKYGDELTAQDAKIFSMLEKMHKMESEKNPQGLKEALSTLIKAYDTIIKLAEDNGDDYTVAMYQEQRQALEDRGKNKSKKGDKNE
jgi:hypothetical protein